MKAAGAPKIKTVVSKVDSASHDNQPTLDKKETTAIAISNKDGSTEGEDMITEELNEDEVAPEIKEEADETKILERASEEQLSSAKSLNIINTTANEVHYLKTNLHVNPLENSLDTGADGESSRLPASVHHGDEADTKDEGQRSAVSLTPA